MAAGAAVAVVFGMLLAQYTGDPTYVLTAAAVLVSAPFVWRSPRLGLYGLTAGAVAIETFRLRFPDSLTDVIPFFRSLDSLGSQVPAPLTPGEMLVLLTLAAVVVRRVAAGRAPLERGPLFVPVTIFFALSVLALVRGVTAGGDLNTGIWELRSTFYFAGAVVLAYNLVREPGQIRVLFWIILIATAFKGVLGMWRYLVTLDGDVSLAGSLSPNTNALFAHEESYFFAFFVVMTVALFVFRTGKVQRLFALVFLLPVLLALLANERRAGIAVLLVGLLVVAAAAYALEPSRRKMLVSLVLVGLVMMPPYILMFGQNSGAIAQPARAIVSVFQPDDRDLSSNVYREIEYENVRRTTMESPIIGAGYGRPFTMYEPLPDISDSYAFWDTVPHNSLAWIWLRLGLIGVVVFWFLIGRAILAGGIAARATPVPYLRAAAVLTLAAIMGWLVMGALDMGLVNVRLAIFAGVLIGAMSRIPAMTPAAARPPGTPVSRLQ